MSKYNSITPHRTFKLFIAYQASANKRINSSKTNEIGFLFRLWWFQRQGKRNVVQLSVLILEILDYVGRKTMSRLKL